jgi:hypothetical protein
MFSQVLLKSLSQSILAPWCAVLTASFPKVWADIPRLLVDPFVLESRSFAPFRFVVSNGRCPFVEELLITAAVANSAATAAEDNSIDFTALSPFN